VARTVTRSSAITWVEVPSSRDCMPATVAPNDAAGDHGYGQRARRCSGTGGSRWRSSFGPFGAAVVDGRSRQADRTGAAHCDGPQKSRRELQAVSSQRPAFPRSSAIRCSSSPRRRFVADWRVGGRRAVIGLLRTNHGQL
jgi:hypothetical protein